MKSSRLSVMLAAAAIAAVATSSMQPSAGFTRGSHTTRRRIDPVQRHKPSNADIARWNAEVDRRKAERKGRA
ncbi:hypothetical protein LJR175_003141 [Variovorax sp. LjRoot175]|uniref:hypothetical protein n=1 Tax=Variovorax sp. LjRoot175 TaxID=3342276 RepID=UPI003ED075BA